MIYLFDGPEEVVTSPSQCHWDSLEGIKKPREPDIQSYLVFQSAGHLYSPPKVLWLTLLTLHLSHTYLALSNRTNVRSVMSCI